MLPAPFSVTFDHEQTRVQQHPVAAQAWGAGWSGPYYSDTWIDPITETLSLRPMCFYGEFFTTNSGIHAKPARTAYDFDTDANWSNPAVTVWDGAGACMMQTDVSGGWLRTSTAIGKNRGILVTTYVYGAGDKHGLVYTAGWSSSVQDTSAALAYELYADGLVLIYKASALVGSGKVSMGQSGQGGYLHLFVQPQRKRELLFVTLDGDGFVWVDDDIAETATSPEITPNTKFFLKPAAAATSAQAMLAPAKYETTGYATSELVTFPRPPAAAATLQAWDNPLFTGITTANLYGDKSYSGTDDVSALTLRLPDDSGAFSADGSSDQARLKITLTSDGSYTSFVFGAYAEFPAVLGVTDDSEESTPDSLLAALVIDVPDDPWGGKATATYNDPSTVAASVPKLRTVSNRPGKVKVGSLVLLDGRTKPTRFEDGVQGEVQRCVVEIEDMTAALRRYVYRDRYVCDGFYLSRSIASGDYSIVQKVLADVGIPTTRMRLSTDAYILPQVPGGKSSEFSFSIEPGDTAQKVLERLHQEFAADWFMGPRPTASGVDFCFLSPTDLVSTPVMTLYRTAAAAASAGKPRTQVYQKYDDQPEEVDANEVWASGYDHRKGEGVQAYATDAASIDCTTAPSSRPDNWKGEPALFGVVDPLLRTLEDCERAVEFLTPVVMSQRLLGEYTPAEMCWYDSGGGVMLPLWRGDTVTLEDVGDVVVTSLSVTAVRNASGHLVTDARYTFGGFTNAGGTSLTEIQRANARRRARGSLLFGAGDALLSVQGRFTKTRRSGP